MLQLAVHHGGIIVVVFVVSKQLIMLNLAFRVTVNLPKVGTCTFNQSLSSSELPKNWKIGKVVPVLEGGDSTHPVITNPFHLHAYPAN